MWRRKRQAGHVCNATPGRFATPHGSPVTAVVPGLAPLARATGQKSKLTWAPAEEADLRSRRGQQGRERRRQRRRQRLTLVSWALPGWGGAHSVERALEAGAGSLHGMCSGTGAVIASEVAEAGWRLVAAAGATEAVAARPLGQRRRQRRPQELRHRIRRAFVMVWARTVQEAPVQGRAGRQPAPCTHLEGHVVGGVGVSPWRPVVLLLFYWRALEEALTASQGIFGELPVLPACAATLRTCSHCLCTQMLIPVLPRHTHSPHPVPPVCLVQARTPPLLWL
jgi:hypothetical protein